MNLTEFLKEEGILLNMAAHDKWEAIRKMVATLVQKGMLTPGQQKPVLDALVARENMSSTGMDHGIALPHAVVNAVDHPVAALGVLPEGVNFQSVDNKPSHLIALLIIPKKSSHIHIRTLAAVARMLNFEEMRHSLLVAKSAQEVLRVIREEEQKEILPR